MKQNGQPWVVDINRLVEALSLSRARVYDLVRNGTIPRASRGQYDLVACVRGYIQQLRLQREDTDAVALRRAKVRRARLENRIRRRQLERLEGRNVVPVAVVDSAMREAMGAFYTAMIGVSAQIAPKLVSLRRPHEAFEIVDEAIRAALVEGHRQAIDRVRAAGSPTAKNVS